MMSSHISSLEGEGSSDRFAQKSIHWKWQSVIMYAKFMKWIRRVIEDCEHGER